MSGTEHVHTLDDYLVTPSRGRGRGLTKRQKQEIWPRLSKFAADLASGRAMDIPDRGRRGGAPGRRPPEPTVRHVVVDEIQDLQPAQWRLLRAAAPTGPDDLFLTGDPHQRIYGNHVSLRRVGIDVRGRTAQLRINYRTASPPKTSWWWRGRSPTPHGRQGTGRVSDQHH